MPLTPISDFIQVIPGFLQTRASANQGIPLLGQEFILDYDSRGLAHVELDEWNSDWKIQAEWVYRLALGGPPPKILVVAYSWGCGFGFCEFAKKLRDRGIEITWAVLVDPVYHWGARWMHSIGLAQAKAYYPYFHCTRRLIDWSLLPPRPQIVIPDNVLKVDYFLQENSPLRGHELRCQSPRTEVTKTIIKYRTHTNMDDSGEFLAAARLAAKTLFSPPAQTPPRPARKPRAKL